MYQGRVRILSLIVKLFSVSRAVAEKISNSNLLGLIEGEARKTDDTLATLNVLELLFEVNIFRLCFYDLISLLLFIYFYSPFMYDMLNFCRMHAYALMHP